MKSYAKSRKMKKNKVFMVLLGAVCIMLLLIFIFKSVNKSENSGNQEQPESTKITTVPITPEPNGTVNYVGPAFSFTYPGAWKASLFGDCGELDNETVLLTIPVAKPTNAYISACYAKAENTIDSQAFNRLKSTLIANINKGLVDKVTEERIGGKAAVLTEFTRKDFPGNYEKSVYIVDNQFVYRITLAIQAKDTATLNRIKDQEEPSFAAFLSTVSIHY